MNAAGEFIVYDNIQYSKKGWINRNRFLVNGQPAYFTITLKNESDFLDIRERHISPEWKTGKIKALNRILEAYRKAPYIESVYPIVEKCFMYDDDNLFGYIYNSLVTASAFLVINTPLVISSMVKADHSLKSADRVISICNSRKAVSYLNPEGGMELYDRNYFSSSGVSLQFIKSTGVIYRQFDNDFVPSLSVIDVMMFNSHERIRDFLENAFVIN
jgi:hypothetical protein